MKKFIYISIILIILLFLVTVLNATTDNPRFRQNNDVANGQVFMYEDGRWNNTYIDTAVTLSRKSHLITNQTNYTWTNAVASDYICNKIIIHETSGNNAGNIRIGTTDGGEEVISEIAVNSNNTYIIEPKWELDWTSATTLYINSDSWGTGEIKVYLLMNKITQ